MQEHQLDNGLTVLLMPESRAPIVSVQVWYRVGSRNEVLGKTGLSHLLEHLMFRGTEKYGPKVFSRLLQQAGASNNAFTAKDYTAYFETGPVASLRLFLELEADRMRHLKFSEDLFRPEQQVVLEERRLRTEDDPVNSLYEELVATAFKAHPYQWPIIGWMHDIASLTLADLRQYYDRYYQPNNATLVVVGDIDPATTLQFIQETFGQIPRGPEPPPFRALEPPQQGERRTEITREAQLPALFLAYHVPNLTSAEAFPLEVLSLILAQGHSSRLHRRLVYEAKVALDVGAEYEFATASPSLFVFYAQPLPGKSLAQVEQLLEAEIDKIKKQLVSEDELLKAKNQTEAAFIMGQDSLFYRGMLLGRYQTIGSWQKLNDIVPGIRAVTAADVQRVAQKYLVPTNRTVGILNPLKPSRPTTERFVPHEQVR
ncbi:MAG: M16 family metallopeptidase [Desulfobacca sp.]|uniref:M16 family metallopeptidase n=1 Tax=Desulfobacca sp. TaxID=2067990 RepID=UPI00404AED6C